VAAVNHFRPSWASLEGLPFPLGATWIAADDGWNFAVHSEHAERVRLLLYGEEDPASPILARRSVIRQPRARRFRTRSARNSTGPPSAASPTSHGATGPVPRTTPSGGQ